MHTHAVKAHAVDAHAVHTHAMHAHAMPPTPCTHYIVRVVRKVKHAKLWVEILHDNSYKFRSRGEMQAS